LIGTAGVNEVHEVHEGLSDLAQRLGRWMAEQCADGLPGHFGDDLLEAFPEESSATIASALAELAADGLVTLTSLIGPKLPRIWTMVALFVACDAGITGQDPVDDSVILARMLLDDPTLGGNARDLEAASGWERRRFNPAFALIVPCIGDGRVRTPDQPDYPVMGILIADEDIVALRNYIHRHTR
jgi:hypothetical protein